MMNNKEKLIDTLIDLYGFEITGQELACKVDVKHGDRTLVITTRKFKFEEDDFCIVLESIYIPNHSVTHGIEVLLGTEYQFSLKREDKNYYNILGGLYNAMRNKYGAKLDEAKAEFNRLKKIEDLKKEEEMFRQKMAERAIQHKYIKWGQK